MTYKEPMSFDQFYGAFSRIEKMPKNARHMLEQLYQFYCNGFTAGYNNKTREIIEKLELKTL